MPEIFVYLLVLGVILQVLFLTCRKEVLVQYSSSVLHGIGIFLVLLPLVLGGGYVFIREDYSQWFSVAPWPFSSFSSLGDQVVLFLSLILLGVVFAVLGIMVRTSVFSQTHNPKEITVVSVLRGIAVLSILFPVLNEIYVEWLLSIPAPTGEPYSTEFSNLLKGPFPLSWYGSGLFFLYMYASALIFGGVILTCAEVIRSKLKSWRA